MKSLFEPGVTREMVDRINRLAADTKPLWGKMRVEQMLAHMQSPLRVALGEEKLMKGLMGFLFGKIAKKQLVTEAPFKKNLPTAPSFIIKEEKNFEEEKSRVIDLVQRFSTEPKEKLDTRVHPFFGKLSADEWNILHWKHLDHHLRQFGV
ncbi:MAG TPA: DUF1569 domain-containing protein [Chitinophagaceae bacterium]|nr:DUF1569 domain-containing protein [Chitinophagaceae bacterium]